MLISKVDIENGSLIDKISGSLATKTGSVIGFKKSDIGLVLSNDGTNANYVDIVGSETMTNSGDWSISISINLKEVATIGFISNLTSTTSTGWSLTISGGVLYLFYYDAANVFKLLSFNTTLMLGKWYLATVVYLSGTFYVYLDNNLKGTQTNTLSSNSNKITLLRYRTDNIGFCLNGSIGTPSIYNHALTPTERNNEYKKFLQSFSIGLKSENQRMFDRPKAKYDNDSNVVIHLNMQPSSGGVLIDITGSGLSFPINGALSTKDGMAFNNNNVNLNKAVLDSLFVSTGQYSINLRVKFSSITTGTIFVYSTSGTDRHGLIINGGRLIYLQYNGSSYIYSTSDALLTTNQWYTISITYNNRVITQKINGVLQTGALAVGGLSGSLKLLGNGNDSLIGEIEDFVVKSNIDTLQQAKDYHNSFRKPQLISKFKYDGADGNVKTPIGYSKGTGAGKVQELTAYVNSELGVGDKYFEFTTAGTLLYKGIDLSSYVNNGYIDYWYMPVGTGVWAKRSGYLNAPVTGVAYANNTLTFTGSNVGDRIANAVVHNQILI